LTPITDAHPRARDAAGYIAELTADLARLARENGFKELAYMLEVARLEAEMKARQGGRSAPARRVEPPRGTTRRAGLTKSTSYRTRQTDAPAGSTRASFPVAVAAIIQAARRTRKEQSDEGVMALPVPRARGVRGDRDENLVSR
jgi:hypothetical protein